MQHIPLFDILSLEQIIKLAESINLIAVYSALKEQRLITKSIENCVESAEAIRTLLKNNKLTFDKLKIIKTGLTQLPAEIGLFFTKLKELHCSKNLLANLPPEIIKLIDLHVIYLSFNKFADFPIEVCEFKDLQVLNLTTNYICTLPPAISRLKSLKDLSLSHNRLKILPPEIGELKSLENLNINDNYITALPSEIGQLQKLKTCYCLNNQLTALPEEYFNLVNLEMVSFEGNKIAVLSQKIDQLVNLMVLNVVNNKLSSIPAEIVNLVALQTLEAADNEIESLLPEVQFFIKHLPAHDFPEELFESITFRPFEGEFTFFLFLGLSLEDKTMGQFEFHDDLATCRRLRKCDEQTSRQILADFHRNLI